LALLVGLLAFAVGRPRGLPEATAAVPAAVVVVATGLLPWRDAVAELRTAVDVAAAGPDVIDRMTVVANELATNALRHGLPPTVVRLLREGDRLIVDVSDHDREAEPRVAENRPLGDGGLGLQLTRRFAIDVGWYATELTKHVWASFPR
jgi:anti-sigma regulatory factor (Ser/Thr protein kinase)